VQKLKRSVDVGTHGIKVVFDKLLADDSEWSSKKDEWVRGEGTQGVLSMFNWGWGRKKPGNTRGHGDDPDEEVPPVRSAIEVGRY